MSDNADILEFPTVGKYTETESDQFDRYMIIMTQYKALTNEGREEIEEILGLQKAY